MFVCLNTSRGSPSVSTPQGYGSVNPIILYLFLINISSCVKRFRFLSKIQHIVECISHTFQGHFSEISYLNYFLSNVFIEFYKRKKNILYIFVISFYMLNLSSGLDYGAERQVLGRIRNSAKDKVKAKRPTGGDVQA